MGYLPHHTQCYGLDSRTTKSARSDTQAKLTALNVYGCTHKGIDERYSISTLSLTCTGYSGNICDIWRELHYKSLVITLPDGTNNAGSSLA